MLPARLEAELKPVRPLPHPAFGVGTQAVFVPWRAERVT